LWHSYIAEALLLYAKHLTELPSAVASINLGGSGMATSGIVRYY